jgi:hypothetical protein
MKQKNQCARPSWSFNVPIGRVLFPEIFQDKDSLRQELPFRELLNLKKKPRLLRNYFEQSGFRRSLLSDCLVQQNKSSLHHWLKNYSRMPQQDVLLTNSLTKTSASKLRHNIESSFVLSQAQRFNLNIRKACFFLSRIFHCPTGANVYFTPKVSQTFPRHSDPHDVFILQLQGEKRWKVYPKGSKKSDHPVIEGVLERGDLLMIPKGFEHEGATSDQTSLHVTFGLYKATRTELGVFKKTHPFNIEKGMHGNKIWHFLFYLRTFQICQSDPILFFFRARHQDHVLALGHRKMFSLARGDFKKYGRKMESNFQNNKFLLDDEK